MDKNNNIYEIDYHNTTLIFFIDTEMAQMDKKKGLFN